MLQLFSKQKWLINSIPNKFTESDELIRILLFKILTDFVESKMALDEIFWNSVDFHKKVEESIMDSYDWIMKDRPLLVDKMRQMEDLFPEVPEDESLWKFVNKHHIGEIVELHNELFKRDQTVLKTIIDNRQFLTTI